ncbi:MAG: PHP domain-containing protein, partial [Clostridiaceae bacterium]|nr:PHP domain-containing protein [Clostridiaceae bacterium]
MQELAFKEGFVKILSKEVWDGQDIESLFGNIKVQEINLYKKSRKMEVKVISDRLIPAQTIAEIEEKFTGYFCLNCVDIKVKYAINDKIEELLDSYWENIIFFAGRKLATSRGLLSGCSWKLSKRKLSVYLKTKGAGILKAQECGKFIEDIIDEAFSTKVKVEFIDCIIDESYNNKYIEEKKAQEQKLLSNVIYISENNRKNSSSLHKKVSGQDRMANESAVILGKEFKDEIIAMKDIDQDSGKIAIAGEIFSIDSREIRGERYLYIFDITDKTNSFTVKFFTKKDKYGEINNKLKIGIAVKVRGEAQYDKFSREVVIMASDIVKIEKQKQRVDAAQEKRIELHLHTQMSSMDGITPVEDLVKRAAEWGHKAVAITDHGVVQAYPGASKAASKYKIKIIYGVECYLVDDTNDENFDYTKAESYHAIILVKNKTGLKNLYKLISQSHLSYFYKRPRMTKSMIMEYREGLLIGSACEAGELYSAVLENASDEEIYRIASFYDYLEIQPLGNNQFLVESGKVDSREALKD